jgi:general secretion pathway protein D
VNRILPGLIFVFFFVSFPLLSEERMNIDLQNVELMEFIKTVSKATKRNFLIEADVRGQITILGPRPIPVGDLWRIFLSVLDARGYAVVRSGNIYRIVVAQSARTYTTPIVVGRDPVYTSDQYITQIVPIEYADPDQVANFIKNFAGTKAGIFAHKPANTVIITDTGANIQRLLELIKVLDSAEGEEVIAWIPLKFIGVSDAIQILKAAFGGGDEKSPVLRVPASLSPQPSQPTSRGGKPGGVLRFIADERLNRLIVIGSKERIEHLKSFLKDLDQPSPEGRNVHVYYLRYGDAEQIAQVLNELISAGAGQAQPGQKPQGSGKVVANKALNALIFFANRSDLQEALTLLRKLDVPRPQVYVEAAIMEVFLDDTRRFSIAGGAARSQDIAGQPGTVFGGAALGISPFGLTPEALATLNGIFAGAIVTPSSGTLPPLGVILSAVQGNNNVRVLSTPHLLMLDNEEAEIVVGDNVPFLTGQTATPGGNVLTSIERRDVGLTLKVTPQINESNLVKLRIYQEISSVSPQAPAGLDINRQGVITSKRSARTHVVVPDGETVAIGGLISENLSTNEAKVPILGDLPILGWLFKSHQRERRRTNLVIFLTPHIVRTDIQLQVSSLEIIQRFREKSSPFLSDPQIEYLNALPRRKGATPTTEAIERYFEEQVVKPEGPPPSENLTSPTSHRIEPPTVPPPTPQTSPAEPTPPVEILAPELPNRSPPAPTEPPTPPAREPEEEER